MASEYDGIISLDFIKKGERTLATRNYRAGNSRISANIPVAEPETPVYFLITTGGGFLEGEQYLTTINCQSDSHAVLTTQTPNYIFKCPGGMQTYQKTEVCVQAGAFLEYYLDEVIAYNQANYFQDTAIYLEKGASLILSDGFTSGWSPENAPYQFSKLAMRTRIYYEDDILYNDHVILEPGAYDVNETGIMEGYQNFNSLVIIDEELSDDFLEQARHYLSEQKFKSQYALSSLERHGYLLRIFGDTINDNQQIAWAFTNYYRQTSKHLQPLNLRKQTKF